MARIHRVGVLATAVLWTCSAGAQIDLGLRVGQRSTAFGRDTFGTLELGIPLAVFAPGPRPLRVAENAAVDPAKPSVPLSPGDAAVPPNAPDTDPLLPVDLGKQVLARVLQHASPSLALLRLSELESRARLSAWLPSLTLRAGRSEGASLRYAPTVSDPERYTQAGTAELFWEGRVTWRLERLVASGQELQFEAQRRALSQQRAALLDATLRALTDWQKGWSCRTDPLLDDDERRARMLKAWAAEVWLDWVTDGWFGQEVERRGLRASRPASPESPGTTSPRAPQERVGEPQGAAPAASRGAGERTGEGAPPRSDSARDVR